jgi:CDP-4-dehydro-6-deoxyglucose reductase
MLPLTRFKVHIGPVGRVIEVCADENVLGAALAAGIPLPHSCRAGRCASCKAKLLSGEIAYPGGQLPPGIVAAEAARGEVLLCQVRPRSELRIETRAIASAPGGVCGVIVEQFEPVAVGGTRVRVRVLGAAATGLRPGKFVDVETASGERERVPVVAAGTATIDVETHELAPAQIVRMRGPFDAPR